MIIFEIDYGFWIGTQEAKVFAEDIYNRIDGSTAYSYLINHCSGPYDTREEADADFQIILVTGALIV